MNNQFKLILLCFFLSKNYSFTQGTLKEINRHFEYGYFNYYESDTLYKGTEGGRVNFGMPKFTLEETGENRFYQLGVDLGNKSRYVCLGFKVDSEKLVYKVFKKDTFYIIPICYIDASNYSHDSRVDVYTSQKFRRKWKWLKKSLKKSRHTTYHEDGNDFIEFGGFLAIEKIWKYGEIYLPKDYDLSKDIWIYFVLQDPRDRTMLYFPMKAKEE